jgi:hypothetical protein
MLFFICENIDSIIAKRTYTCIVNKNVKVALKKLASVTQLLK